MLEDPDVGGRAADVDDRAVCEAGEEGSAAHRVGRARREGRDRVALCVVDGHQRAVVLAQVDGRLDPELGETGVEGGDDLGRKLVQAGVHDRRVLTLEQADPADLVRERDRDARQLFRDDGGRFLLRLGVDGGEHR